MIKYTAKAERDGKVWLVRVLEVNLFTQARTIDEIEPMARDLIAIMENVPADSFDVAVEIVLPPDIAAHLKTAACLREEIEEATRKASEEARIAAQMLAKVMPLREVGKVMHVSHQRVHQLVNS